MGRSSKIKHSKEPVFLPSKELAIKKARKMLGTEEPEPTKDSQNVVKRRRRTKTEMALSYEPRNPDQSGHILELGYDLSANLERCVRGKSSDTLNCTEGRGSFWILDDSLILAVQKKMEALEKQNVQSLQQDTARVPLVGLKCLPKQTANNLCLTMNKTIIQVSHAVPIGKKQAVKKQSSEVALESEYSAETSGLGQTDNDTSLNSSSSGLKGSVQNKNNDASGTVATVHDNTKPATELNMVRVLQKTPLVGEECVKSISGVLEGVAIAGASSSSIHVETQRNEVCSEELAVKPGIPVTPGEDEVKRDCSGDVEVPHLEIQSLENQKSSNNSQPSSRCNSDGLQRLVIIDGDICQSKQKLNCPVVSIERIPQECFPSGNDNCHRLIQTTNIPVTQAEICVSSENSLSLGRGHNIAAEITGDHEKEVERPSLHQGTSRRRTRKRKRKQLFTRRKKCKDAGANATKLKYPSVDNRNSWTFQSSITDQVQSGCHFPENSCVREMEISPEVESAASVLAMMSAGGRLFTAFQRGERRWDSGRAWQQHPPTLNTGARDFLQAGKYMCEVCGHVFVDLAMLKQHITEHEKPNQKSARKKQLSHKPSLPTTSKTNAAQADCLVSPPNHFATMKSCTSTIDGTNTHSQKVQNLECKGLQSGHQPTTAVTQYATFKDVRPNQESDISQMGEVDRGGALASTSAGSVIDNEEVQEAVDLFDTNGTSSKDSDLNRDNGTLQTVGAESMINQQVQNVVNLNARLSDKNDSASDSQTNAEGSRCTQVSVPTLVTVRTLENEKENIRLTDTKEIPMEVDASCNSDLVGKDTCENNQSEITSDLVGKDTCENNQSEITSLPYETTNEFNAESQRSALGGSMSDVCSTKSQSSVSTASEHDATVSLVGTLFASEWSTKAKSDAFWGSDVCFICNHKFSNAANMRKHIRMQHNSYRPHKCQTCGKGFPYPSSLVEHMTSHSNAPGRLVCEKCGKAFVRQSGLRKHVKEQHETTRPHGCNHCDKRFLYLCALKEHQRSHSQERTFKCTKCDCVFKQASNLLMHIRKRHLKACECPPGSCVCRPKAPRPLPSFSCVICSKVFHARKQLEIHLDIHAGKKPLGCQVCDKEFPNKFLLSKHRLKHQETKTFSCEVCSRNFLSKQALKLHQESHSGIKPYQCESCGKQYTTKNSLKIHSIRHLEVLPYACDKCNKTFALRTNLTKHMAIHTKEHVFVCCHCDKTFYCNTDLKKHVLLHEEQKTFVCSYCSQKFLHESNLKMHIVKHTGERPHSCGVCGRCFSLKANLRRHMQMHMKKNGHIVSESSIPMPGAYVVLGPE